MVMSPPSREFDPAGRTTLPSERADDGPGGGDIAVLPREAPGRPSGRPDEQHSADDDPIPARAEGVELLGPLAGSGYRQRPHLVRRVDGQTVQLTELLYLVLDAIDGKRDHAQIAAQVSERVGKRAGADDIRFLIDEKLRPVGLLREHDGSEPAVRKRNPLLALRFRYVVSNPKVTRRLTDPFTWLFRPMVVTAFVAAFTAVSGWLLLEKGVGSGAHQLMYEPGIFLVVFALGLVSAGFHELGHAAACRYGGATPGVMGVALYLIWPAFYTDVTDSYRLDRRGRLRVDLGGLYFNAIFAVAMFALWTFVRWDAVLLLIPLQLAHMVRQLLPFVRLDGYHILADLTGVPDLFARIGPTLRSMIPGRSTAEARVLHRWARVVVTLWVLCVIPVLLASLVGAVLLMPRLVATAWDSLGQQWDGVRGKWSDGALSGTGVGVIAMASIAVPVLSICYLLSRVTYRTSASVWRKTEGRPVLRGIAATVAAGLLALVAWSWWPNDQYRPIESDDRGTLFDAVGAETAPVPDDSAEGSGQSIGNGARYAVPPTFTIFGQPVPQRPTVPALYVFGHRIRPALHVVDGSGTAAAAALREQVGEVLAAGGELSTPPATDDPPATGGGTGSRTIVVPLPTDPALVPLPAEGEHDNQAIAFNDEDGSTVYETAFTILWEAGDIVDPTNVADARASCTDCVTVAVAFQVVLVQGDPRTAVPENHAVALNVGCDGCTTLAFATQLVFTVPETLSDDAMGELQQLWNALVALEQRIEDIPLTELYAEIAALEAAFVSFLTSDVVQGADDTLVAGAPGPDTGSSTTTVPGTSTSTEGLTTGSGLEAPVTTPQTTTSPATPTSEPTTATTAPAMSTTAPPETTTSAPTTSTIEPSTTTTEPTSSSTTEPGTSTTSAADPVTTDVSGG